MAMGSALINDGRYQSTTAGVEDESRHAAIMSTTTDTRGVICRSDPPQDDLSSPQTRL
jgi:hypothetical protein